MAFSGQQQASPPPLQPSTPPAAAGGVYTLSQQIQEQEENQATIVTMAVSSNPSYLLHEEDRRAQQLKSSGQRNSRSYMVLLGANYLCLFLGSVSSTLLTKFYFNHKGRSRWVSTWVQSAGFPILLLPIYLPYYLLKCTERRPFSGFTPKLLILSILVGFLLGLNNLFFSWGSSYLPVSTFSLLLSCQLAFTLILSAVIVKQKINFLNLNCVILLTLSSVLLALGSGHDRQKGLDKSKYFIGFFSAIGAGLLFSLYLPVMEKIYQKVYCYSMVMEMQLIMEFAATILASVGMASEGGFSDMKTESTKSFDLGPKAYWLTVSFDLITWQMCFMGTAGMVFLTTSLTGGICMTALMAINVLGGVLVYGDEFGGVKVVSTLLCVWGFSSYLYGKYMKMKEDKETERINDRNRFMEMAEIVSHGG